MPDPVDGIRVSALARVLALLSDGAPWEYCDTVRWLKPDRIIAEARAPQRLQRARKMLAGGMRLPTIIVTGYRLGRRYWYIPSDGIHRTVAAREAGRRIRARI